MEEASKWGCLQKQVVGGLEPRAEVCKLPGLSCWGRAGFWGDSHQKDYGVEGSQVSNERPPSSGPRENRFVFKGSDRLQRESAADMASAGGV